MKKALTLALVFAALAAFASLTIAQEKGKQEPKQPAAASTVKTSKSNTFRAEAASLQMTGKVTQINERTKSFIVLCRDQESTFNVANLNWLPKAGETIHMWGDPANVGNGYIYLGNKTMGEGDLTGARWVCHSHPPYADFICFDYEPLLISGKVTQIDVKARTFAIMSNGKPVTLDARKLKALPKIGEMVEITYTHAPGDGPMEATNLNSSRSNVN